MRPNYQIARYSLSERSASWLCR